MDIYNVSLYKDARLKQWFGYLCKPPVGTCFLGDRRCIQAFGPSPYISSREYNDLCVNNPSLAALLQNTGCVVGPDNYILCDAAGRFIKLCGSQVFGRFRTQSGIVMTEEFVARYSNISKQIQGENGWCCLASDKHGTPADKPQLLQTGVFDWVKVQSLSKEQYKALFVPLGECITLNNGTVVNDPRVGGHGKGDFIVVRLTNQGIYWQNMMCISGTVFQKLFNNIGWTEYLSDQNGYELQKPPSFYQIAHSWSDRDDVVTRAVSRLQEDITKGRYEFLREQSVSIDRVWERISGENLEDDGNINAYDVVIDGETFRVEFESEYNNVTIWHCSSMEGYVKLESVYIGDAKELEEYFMLYGSVQKRGWLTKMRAAYCDLATRNALSLYTGAGFVDINTALGSNTIQYLGIEKYLAVQDIYSYLGRCSLHGMTIFRGIQSVPDGIDVLFLSDVEVGSRIELNSFTSWSLKYSVAEKFAYKGVVFVIKNTWNVHAAYINAISEFRDMEYEVLLNAGYILIVEEKINDKIWLCSLEENEDYHLREKTTPKEDFIKVLGYTIDGDPRLRGSVYVQEIESQNFYICSSFSSSMLPIEIGDSKWTCGELSGSLDDIDGSVTKVIKYLLKVVSKIREKLGSDKLYYHCSSFMYNITSKFASEGFQIIRQKFINRDDISQKKSMRGALQISGDSDDHITLQFLIKDDLSVSVSARDKENQIRQTFSAIDNEVYQNVYDEVVHKCKLNQFGRLEKALKLVSGYCREPLTVVGKGKYSLGSKYQVIAVMDGEMVQLYIRGGIKSSHSYYFWDNLRDIAVGVSNALCGNEKK